MINKYYYTFKVSNLHFIVLLNEDKIITYINIEDDKTTSSLIKVAPDEKIVLQFSNYFKGNLKEFNFNYQLNGTNFQIKVWETLMKVPYGKIISYLELARLVGNEKAVRAVASAVANNPIVIAIPCHRIIRSDSKIGNYSAGGPKVKEMLINLEKKVSSNLTFLF